MDKKIFSWGLYDFANSLWVANSTLYISLWVVVDNKTPDIFYGLVFTLSSILLIFTTPFFGLWSDRIGKRMPFLWVLSVLTVILGVAITLFGIFIPAVFWKVFLVLFSFLFLNYFYQLSLLFFNALLPKLATRKNLGWISGFGDFMGYLGWIVGAAITLPIVSGKFLFFDGSPRIQTILPTSILFMLFALPMLLLIKDELPRLGKFRFKITSFFTQTFKGFLETRRYPGMMRFLIAFYFYSDAILTTSLFFPIYFQEVLGLPDTGKVMLLTFILVGGGIGSAIFGLVGDRIGHKQGVILSGLGSVVCLLVVLPVSKVTPVVYGLAFLLGIFWGGVWVLSRSLLVVLAPSQKIGELFGYHAMSAKFASIIGPLIWGMTVLAFGFLGPSKYRMALISMVLLFLIGLYILRKVPNQRVLKET